MAAAVAALSFTAPVAVSNQSVSSSATRRSVKASASKAAVRANGPARFSGFQGLASSRKAGMFAAKEVDITSVVAATVSRAGEMKKAPTVCMAKKSVSALKKSDLEGKRVFVRCDLNVPLDGTKITDDTRIRAAIPTIQYLIDNGAKVLLTTHLGRPKGKDAKYTVAPLVGRLNELLHGKVKMVGDCIGPEVEKAVKGMANGTVLLLENVRFYPEEEKNVKEFSQKLAANADLYVNDAFGTAHRAHSSTAARAPLLRHRRRLQGVLQDRCD
eukprot:jgi/Mesvir1/8747/Mv26115-RA.1